MSQAKIRVLELRRNKRHMTSAEPQQLCYNSSSLSIHSMSQKTDPCEAAFIAKIIS